MNYNKIKLLSEQKKLPLRVLAQKIKVSEQGLYRMIKEQKMFIHIIEKIANEFNVPIAYFFNDDNPHFAPSTNKSNNIDNDKFIPEEKISINISYNVDRETGQKILKLLNK